MKAPFVAFGAVWFCYFAAIGMFNPYAPLWFKDLGYSTLAIGGIVSLQSWTRVLAPYGWGWLGGLHPRVDWTNGCIAVTNAEIDEIWSLVPNGTPIEITG